MAATWGCALEPRSPKRDPLRLLADAEPLDRDDDDRLAERAAPAATRHDAAHVALIHLDHTGKALAPLPDHRPAELV